MHEKKTKMEQFKYLLNLQMPAYLNPFYIGLLTQRMLAPSFFCHWFFLYPTQYNFSEFYFSVLFLTDRQNSVNTEEST